MMKCCPIADSHNDFLTNNSCNLELLNNEFEKNNVALCNAILFSNADDPLNIRKSKKLKNKILPYENLTKSCIFSFENIDFIRNDITFMLEFPAFSCSLTWNADNKYAGGAYGFSGLTNKGKTLIKELNNHNILIDTAHLNRRSFWDVVNTQSRPIFNSHTCISPFKEHRRNIDVEQIKVICESNGFLGITFVRDFFTNKKKAKPIEIFYMIDSIAQVFGVDNVGFGSDFNGTTDLPKKLKSYNDFGRLYKCFASYGYRKDEIEQIFYKNFLNFVKRQQTNCF